MRAAKNANKYFKYEIYISLILLILIKKNFIYLMNYIDLN